jgi:ABC-2 type transport system ATP-binding protein
VANAVIEVHGLTKQYRRLRGKPNLALDRLDLSVPEGGVFGFLGPNGSGKTTTIRCLLGLVRPTSGRTSLLGADSSTALASVIGRVGSLVEAPAAFANFSGRRNLSLWGRTHGIGHERVEEVLELVGLTARADDNVRTYSLGMRQRLGIAQALLRDPAVIILDEPANGLDPAGIREVRELLRTLGNEGRTVFLSSHLLSEVQQVCDRVAILSRGRCIAEGGVDDVLHRGHAAGVVVRIDDPVKAVRILQDAGFDALLDHEVIRIALPAADAANITRVLAAKRMFVSELRPEEVSLEDVFLELTGGIDGKGIQ